jgi:para-nitrobenzyl esterase
MRGDIRRTRANDISPPNRPTGQSDPMKERSMNIAVKTTAGVVAGSEVGGGIAAFRGVPFAAAPVGALRFRPPQPPESWDGTRDATAFGDVVPQAPSPGIFHELFDPIQPQGPDCLNLNVWTPDPSANLPVLVWIHGGAFTSGSGSDSVYDGTAFARDGVVTVTINYRLGAHGFHHLGAGGVEAPGTGAFGVLDQIAALEWVQDNIASFGGDPSNVTIAGESAGGMSVGTLLGAPGARGLFRRAIPQSGAADHGLPESTAARIARELAGRLGIDLADVDAWRRLPDAALIDAQRSLGEELMVSADVTRFGEAVVSRMAWQPMYGGDVLPTRPIDAIAGGSASGVDVLVGTTREEFLLFLGTAPELLGITEDAVAPTFDAVFGALGRSGAEALDVYRRNRPGAAPVELLAALETDRMFRAPAIRLAEAQVANGARTFAYLLSWRSPAFDGRIGAAHGLDIPFAFDNLDDPMAQRLLGTDPPQALADEMHGAWVRFMTDGDPGWPAYDLATRTTRDFGGDEAFVDDPNRDERLLWSADRA